MSKLPTISIESYEQLAVHSYFHSTSFKNHAPPCSSSICATLFFCTDTSPVLAQSHPLGQAIPVLLGTYPPSRSIKIFIKQRLSATA